MLAKFVDSLYRKSSTLASFKTERTCNYSNSQSTNIFGDTSDYWSSTCPRSTTHTSSDEDHICSLQSFCQDFFAFFSCLTAYFRLTSGTKSASQLWTELNHCFSLGTAKSLNICICCDEFNTSNTFINHSVDGIAATSTDTNNFNYCALCSSSVK